MKEELQLKLVEVLDGISQGVTQAKDFAVEQLPDVARQYIMFGMVWETAAFLALSLATGLIAWASLTLWRQGHLESARPYKDGFGYYTSSILGGLIVFTLALTSFYQLKSMLLVWLAPKLYLLQGIASLIK